MNVCANRCRGDGYREVRHNHLHATRAPDARRRAGAVRLRVLYAGARLRAHERLETRRIQDEEPKQEQEEEATHSDPVYHAGRSLY